MNTIRPSRRFRRTTLLLGFVLIAANGRGAAPDIYEVRGLTEPVNDVVLSAPTPGLISLIPHGEGGQVAQGGTILELNNRPELLELDRKRVQLQTLSAELERSEMLFKTSSSLPREELERKRAEVAVAQVELAQAEEALIRRKVVAPFAGIITLMPVKVGEYCELGKPVARVVDISEFYAVSNVDPARVGGLRTGHAVEIVIASPSGPIALPGEIVFIAPVIDSASGLLRIKARFANPGERVRPGVAGQLRIPVTHDTGN